MSPDPRKVSNPLRALAVFLGILFAVTAAVLQLHKGMQGGIAYPIAIASCVGSIWLWLIATGQDPSLHDNIDVDAPVGGPSDAAPQGDLSGFKV